MSFAVSEFRSQGGSESPRRAEMTEESPDEALPPDDELFRLIVESAHEYAIFATDLDGLVTTWNAGAERLLGYSEGEALGQHARLIFTPEDRERGVPEREMRAALEAGRAEDMRWHLRRDGGRFWADGYLIP
jgi:PAS domain S-box-containing protein